MTVVIGLLHGATFLSNLPLVLFVSFIGPWQLERTPIKHHLNYKITSTTTWEPKNLIFISKKFEIEFDLYFDLC